MKKNFYILLFMPLLCLTAYGQVKTNMEKIYGLIEKSVNEAAVGKIVPADKLFIEYSSVENYSFLKNALTEKAGNRAKVNSQKANSDFVLNYVVEEAKVKYSDTFTQSFLGRSYVEREVTLKGFSGVHKTGDPLVSKRFEYSEKDTLEYRGLKELGNKDYPFTNPEIPEEPFFSSILEPVIAIGVAVTTIYLLFTVRSK